MHLAIAEMQKPIVGESFRKMNEILQNMREEITCYNQLGEGMAMEVRRADSHLESAQLGLRILEGRVRMEVK